MTFSRYIDESYFIGSYYLWFTITLFYTKHFIWRVSCDRENPFGFLIQPILIRSAIFAKIISEISMNID